MSEQLLNLVDDEHVTVTLLANPLDWRVRAVEEITVDTATSCLRRRSLQVAPLRAHLGVEVPEETTHALLGLYVAPIRRGPLLDFDVSGPEGQAWLLPRIEIADREARLLRELARACGQSISDDLHALLAAVCGFTGELLTDVKAITFEEYLKAGLGRAVPEETLTRWRDAGDVCRDVLRRRIDVFRGYSAPENPALVLPELFADGTITTDEQATATLDEYAELVATLDEQAQTHPPNAAEEFLVVLADYGNSYDMMVAMKVPLDEPFLIKYSERQSLPLSWWRNTATLELVVADARTNHVTLKVADASLRIGTFKALRPGSDEFAYGAFQSRQDAQSRAFYAHDPDRDYRIRLSFDLRLLRRLQIVPYLVAALLTLLSVALLIEGPTDLQTLAIVGGPAALAASVLLVREPSTLGSRLRLISTVCLTTALVVLIVISSGLFIRGEFDTPKDTGRGRPDAPSTP
ncbi:hypothetical protein K8W59_00495 [Nocardioides rotundus]|uniref:hypothetical protein n=1 Tax=Nocardioides rotundus TaxID=1774216 RepID=UPI001CBD70F9|nr:hypothetical protein [Nocardioides rotundus]UAL30076.1 hypothetical protein K8W59_00495 [Nocardioides rotundus]